MTNKFLGASLFLSLILGSSMGYAEEKKKMPILKPTGPLCMFLLDDEGNETNVPGNPPCEVAGVAINPGDTVSPALKKKAGKSKK